MSIAMVKKGDKNTPYSLSMRSFVEEVIKAETGEDVEVVQVKREEPEEKKA